MPAWVLLSALLWLSPEAAAQSVYETRPSIDLPVTLISGGGTLIVYAFGDGLINRRCPCDKGEVNSFDRTAIGNHNGVAEWFSDAAVGTAIVAPVIADWYDAGSASAFTEDMEVFAETLSVNAALVTAAKFTVQRPVPRAYAGEASYVDSPGGYRSFYSGHASTTAAALTAAAQTARLRHDVGWLPWLGAVGVSIGVGLERVAAGKHFYSDIAAGVVMGSAVGTLVPYLHERGAPIARLSLAPIPGGFTASWSVRY